MFVVGLRRPGHDGLARKEQLGPQQVANSHASGCAGCSVPGAMHKDIDCNVVHEGGDNKLFLLGRTRPETYPCFQASGAPKATNKV